MQKVGQKYAQNIQKICKEYAAGLSNMQQVQYAEYAKNMQTICEIYVKYAVYANHATNMQIMHGGLC